MTPKTRNATIVALGTAFALLAYWQTHAVRAAPETLLLVLVEAVTFGLGVLFAMTAWPTMRASVEDARSARVAYVSIAWALLTWTFADAMDVHVGIRLVDAVLSDHTYHVTLVLAGAGVAQWVARLLRERTGAPSGG